ncbi:unnamed protein product [Urochloa decumbens]|uniref:F-box domain-containing protein n=1 Tax=Urochloa decumbens TaxID=240449 RepID=A0ABC9G2T9_9POAL
MQISSKSHQSLGVTIKVIEQSGHRSRHKIKQLPLPPYRNSREVVRCIRRMDADGGACEECRNKQLALTCCRVGLRRSRRTPHPTDGADHISALPDDLRLKIVSDLGCIRAAANLSLLSRTWRGLWRRLPELDFHYICPNSLLAALDQVAAARAEGEGSPLTSGSLNIYLPIHHRLSAARISSILRAAAPVAPSKLDFSLFMDEDADNSAGIELPGFDYTTSIKLSFAPLETTLLPTGHFAKLETMSLIFCQIDLSDLLPRCPTLRKLKAYCWPLTLLKVHSASLQELKVYTHSDLRVIDIATPLLKKFKFSSDEGTENEFSLSFSAPLLVDVTWRWWCLSSFGALWHLWSLKIKTVKHHGPTQHLTSNGEGSCLQLQQRPHDKILLLKIGKSRYARNLSRSFGHDISRVPERKRRGTCHASCPCDQPRNWRSRSITLTNLKEVEVDGFSGEDHEVDLLKVIFRSTTMLEELTLNFPTNVSPECSSAYEELRIVLNAHRSMKFNIYQWVDVQESSMDESESDSQIVLDTSSDESDG